jgi:hypothetical protein
MKYLLCLSLILVALLSCEVQEIEKTPEEKKLSIHGIWRAEYAIEKNDQIIEVFARQDTFSKRAYVFKPNGDFSTNYMGWCGMNDSLCFKVDGRYIQDDELIIFDVESPFFDKKKCKIVLLDDSNLHITTLE